MGDQVARIGDQRLQPMTALLKVCLSNGRPAPIALWLTPKMDAPTYEADKSQSAVKDFHEQALLGFAVGRGYAAELRLCFPTRRQAVEGGGHIVAGVELSNHPHEQAEHAVLGRNASDGEWLGTRRRRARSAMF